MPKVHRWRWETTMPIDIQHTGDYNQTTSGSDDSSTPTQIPAQERE